MSQILRDGGKMQTTNTHWDLVNGFLILRPPREDPISGSGTGSQFSIPEIYRSPVFLSLIRNKSQNIKEPEKEGIRFPASYSISSFQRFGGAIKGGIRCTRK